MFISFFFLSLFFNRYILFVYVFTSQFESTFFFSWKKKRKKNTFDYVFYVTCIPIILTLWSWCCLFNLNDVAKKKTQQQTANNQLHIQIWNSKYWTLIKFEANVNIFGGYITFANLFLFDYLDRTASFGWSIYLGFAITTKNLVTNLIGRFFIALSLHFVN